MQAAQTTIDPAEVAKFEAMAAEWWDPNGKFKPLHMLNPCRLDYITSQIAAEFDRDLNDALPFKGLRILDIGCGGGLLSEPMARLGATVVGADAAEGNLPVARIHHNPRRAWRRPAAAWRHVLRARIQRRSPTCASFSTFSMQS